MKKIFLLSCIATFWSLHAAVVPSVTIHTHLEGALSTNILERFAAKKGKTIPDSAFEYQKTLRYNADNWAVFDASYFAACANIDNEEDFTWLTLEFFKECKALGLIGVEIMYYGGIATSCCAKPLDWKKMYFAGQAALEQAPQHGIQAVGLVTFMRGDAPQKGNDALEYITFVNENRDKLSLFTGVHLAGGEEQFPDVSQFGAAYHYAHTHGFGCSAHAGEVGSASNMSTALDLLPLSRFGHGIGAINDKKLMQRLIDQNITLEVCVTSNTCTGPYTYRTHPLPELMEAGVNCVFGNDDDGRMFATNARKELLTIKDEYGLTDDDILANTKRAIVAGFFTPEQKEEMFKKTAEYEAAQRTAQETDLEKIAQKSSGWCATQ